MKTCGARLACRELTRGSTAAEAGDRKRAERTRGTSLRMTHRTRANAFAHQLCADTFSAKPTTPAHQLNALVR